MVVLLYANHFFCHKIFNEQQRDEYKLDSTQLRIWNEVATLFLFAIVFLVVCKSLTNWTVYGFGLGALAAALLIAIIVYKRKRNKVN